MSFMYQVDVLFGFEVGIVIKYQEVNGHNKCNLILFVFNATGFRSSISQSDIKYSNRLIFNNLSKHLNLININEINYVIILYISLLK